MPTSYSAINNGLVIGTTAAFFQLISSAAKDFTANTASNVGNIFHLNQVGMSYATMFWLGITVTVFAIEFIKYKKDENENDKENAKKQADWETYKSLKKAHWYDIFRTYEDIATIKRLDNEYPEFQPQYKNQK